MSKPAAQQTALCASLPIPAAEGGAAPEWIHLVPAGEIRTVDGRGPYRVADVDGLIRISMQGEARLPIDENHSTDLAAPRGEPAPAMGWITSLQSRADGIWGQVEWTGTGRRLVRGRAYRHISPVIRHLADGTVTGLLRASLVNRPNLQGLTSLHQEDDTMDFMAKLRKALGLADDADEAAVMAKVSTSTSATALQAAIAPIAKAAGLADGADAATVLQAVQDLRDPTKVVPVTAVTALQQELTGVRTELTGLQSSIAKKAAEIAVDAAIKAGKVSAPKAMRDHYIARHMADPAGVEKEFEAMVSLHARGGGSAAPPALDKDGNPGLDAEEVKLIALMGIDPEAYRKTKAAQAAREEAL
ncbi:phage protease [Methylobacterium sp. WL6]|uniref:phage protease n=1 Tax=Methylobacterium sp. WL6 TaxID=2603901 RepID=UPI0011CC1DE1|nr:phage protease [Methylobacterium sp. WL6]TXN71646.1 hypothetical protein FV230_07815 [Methylobacterium sp. WL6]